ncbi:MAG: aminopeptidase [Christensenellales bacterium]|jgi:aminopeptidase
MTDGRMQKLVTNLVNYSCELKEGERILIESRGADTEFINAIIKEVYKVKGKPFVKIIDSRITREIIKGGGKELFSEMAEPDAAFMGKMDAYIGVRGGNNSYEFSDIKPALMQEYSKYYSHPVHHEIRVKKTKWVVLRYPTEGVSQLMGMSTEAFTDFYYKVCNLDYAKMSKAMDPLKELMDRTDKVRITGKDTDITFSIKGIGAVKCKGDRNIPDGEVYSAPVKNSVNGTISYNVPSIEDGIKFENVKLTFKDGKIVHATGNYPEKINSILDTDEGARFVGEFALGVNPYINNPTGDILFDEKIAGSIHLTPGSCYEDADNGNNSAVHWDLVLIQTPEYGGGEIYFDDKLIRKDGLFVLDELKALNPDNYKDC